ncbi:hypothetical protein FRC01_006411, partial [Tulasnella sp. 417]
RLHEDGGFKRLETSTGFKGSIRWCSPELLDGQPRAPTSDVYAWAWLVWEIMTGELPYEGAGADYVIIRKIFESPLPQVNGESRLGECLQVWELMTRCWVVDPQQRPTARMCRTSFVNLPRCPPTPDNTDRHSRSAALLENIGDLESWKGNYTEGLSHLEQALRMYEQEGNDKGVASVLRKQAVVYHRHSYPLKSLQTGVGALEKFRRLDDPLGTAEILYVMGSSLTIQDNEKEAMPFLKEALEIFRAHGNDVGVVQCLERIGEIHKRLDEYEAATTALENAVEIARRGGDKLGEAKVLLILGSLYYYQNYNDKGTSTLAETYGHKVGTRKPLQTKAGQNSLSQPDLASAMRPTAASATVTSTRHCRSQASNQACQQLKPVGIFVPMHPDHFLSKLSRAEVVPISYKVTDVQPPLFPNATRMKLTEKLSQRAGQTPFFTFEFFPPRTDQGFTNLLARISRLTPLNPLAISVTWGAGGSTRDRSMDLAGMSQARFGVDTIMHLTCTNMEQGMVEDALREAKDREITNLLALRGDPPRGSEFWLPIDPGFAHAIDLVKFIKSSPEFADCFCVGVAGYPDGHPDGMPLDEQMQHLKAKVDAGADYIITQLFYDVDNFKDWVRRVRDAGITVPIIPGVMPIQNHTSFIRMAKLCGAKIPAEVTAALEPIRNDDQKVKDYGVELAINIRAEAITQWGTPTSIEDLNAIFTRHLNSDPRTPTTPFSPDTLLAESRMILPQLLEMTRKGWWTVGSQPAVDSAPSNDEVVGWGPAGGYVFQKAFVEFFCDEDTLRLLDAKVRGENGWVTWYAANSQDEFMTNLGDEGRNAVTWGVFPGQEIAQSTIIERASFWTWKARGGL